MNGGPYHELLLHTEQGSVTGPPEAGVLRRQSKGCRSLLSRGRASEELRPPSLPPKGTGRATCPGPAVLGRGTGLDFSQPESGNESRPFLPSASGEASEEGSVGPGRVGSEDVDSPSQQPLPRSPHLSAWGKLREVQVVLAGPPEIPNVRPWAGRVQRTMSGPCQWLARMLWDKQASRQRPQLLTGPQGWLRAPLEIGRWLRQGASPLQPPPDSLLEAGVATGHSTVVCRRLGPGFKS